MKLWHLLYLCCFVSIAYGSSASLESDDEQLVHTSTTIYVEHALVPGQFTHRGTVTLGGVKGDVAKLTQNTLSSGELAQLNVSTISWWCILYLIFCVVISQEWKTLSNKSKI